MPKPDIRMFLRAHAAHLRTAVVASVTLTAGAAVLVTALMSLSPMPAPTAAGNPGASIMQSAQRFTTPAAAAAAAPVERGSFTVYQTPMPTPTPSAATAPTQKRTAAPSPKYNGGGSKEGWMTQAGIPAGDWKYVDYIAARESGWNPNATNPSSGACGLIQALPCSKVPGSGYNPVDNLRWANGYAQARYGSWAKAYDFWVNNHWW